MPVVVMKSKWGVELEGSVIDVGNAASKLNGAIKSPLDFFVSRLNELHVLRTSRWDAVTSISDVAQLALEDIELICGCLNLLDGCGKIEIGTIFEFGDGDCLIKQQRTTELKLRVTKETKDIASPQDFATLLASVDSNDKLRSALSDFKLDQTWYDIYKSLEALIRFYRGEDKLKKQFRAEASDIERMKRTANSFRHTKDKFEPISNPITLPEATALLAVLIRGSVKSSAENAMSGSFESVDISFGVPNHTTRRRRLSA